MELFDNIVERIKILLTLLREWSDKNDKIAHGLLGFGLTLLFHWMGNVCSMFNWTHSITSLVTVECVQMWAFGIKIEDTLLDLFADAVGIIIALALLTLVSVIF